MNRTGYSRMATAVCGVLAVLGGYGQAARADFIYGVATKVPNVNSPSSLDCDVSVSRDGLELYFVSDRPPYESACYLDIWMSRRSKLKEPWPMPVKLAPPVNSDGPQGSPCISADGLELYFSDRWPGLYSGSGSCTPNPNGLGGGDLWVSKRATRADAWGNPMNLGPLVNTASGEDQPSLSPDGLSLYFMSNRPGGYGNTDLYVTTRRTPNDPWSSPVSLGPGINTPSFESCPFISPDGLSVFFSRGTTTSDIFVSERATTTAPWATAIPFGPVNSWMAEYYFSYSEKDSTLYFTRGDDSFAGPTYDVWEVPVLPLVDFNGDGRVDERDFRTMTEHWGQDYPPCDIGPMGWGDGIVDVHDLGVFVETMEGRDFTLSPSPDATDIPRDAILTWTAPTFAQTHDVYFACPI